ncbi:hypothetical protein KJ975_09140 [Myxococcota bacterium]|nr:hypothetical protein [Myxococcota bacterium]
MLRFQKSFLAACCVLVLSAGCQSRAEYPSNCGDGVRQSGEACDGDELDPARDTCAKNSMGDGTVSCNDDCTLDLSMCTGEYDCDPLNNDRCDNGKFCYYEPGSNVAACESEGNLLVGATCDRSRDCRAQHVCVNEVCVEMCGRPSECDNGNACFDAGWPMEWGYCPAVVIPCDPVAQTGCTAFACYLNSTATDLTCLPASTGVVGDDCDMSAYCEPGLACGYGYTNICHQLCWSSDDCDQGSCNTTMITLPYGLGVCF